MVAGTRETAIEMELIDAWREAAANSHMISSSRYETKRLMCRRTNSLGAAAGTFTVSVACAIACQTLHRAHNHVSNRTD